jgi:hypothetical protein
MPRTAKGPDGPKNVTVSVRVSPKVRFGLEMMSRLHHRTVPEIVSDAIDQVFGSEIEGLYDDKGAPEAGGKRPLLNLLWAERPSDRLANIAFECPQLLSSPEKKVWNQVLADPRFWTTAKAHTPRNLRRDELAAHWEELGGEAAVPYHFPGQRRSAQRR